MVETYYPFDGQTISEAEWEKFSELATGVVSGELSELEVLPNTPNDNSVNVSPGRAFIKSFWYENSTAKNLVFVDREPSPRIDRVVVRLDRTANQIQAVVKKGTASSNPVPPGLARDGSVHEISLARVYIAGGTGQPQIGYGQETITDERYDGNACGVIHRWPLLVTYSTTRPSSYPVGALLYNKDIGRLFTNDGTFASPLWVELSKDGHVHNPFFNPYLGASSWEAPATGAAEFNPYAGLSSWPSLPVWRFDDDVAEAIYNFVSVPSLPSLSSVRARVLWFTETAGSGQAVRWKITHAAVGSGQNLDASGTSDGATGTVPTTNKTLTITNVTLTATGYAPGRLMMIKLERDVAHPDDNFSGTGNYDAYFIGMQVEFSA